MLDFCRDDLIVLHVLVRNPKIFGTFLEFLLKIATTRPKKTLVLPIFSEGGCLILAGGSSLAHL